MMKDSSSSRGVVLSILLALLVCEVIILVSNPLPLKEQLQSKVGGSKKFFERPLIVLAKGSAVNKEASYNTAYWAGWGSENVDLKTNTVRKRLPWAGEGVTVTKSCDVSCFVTESQTLLPMADAIVLEVINHPRTFDNAPVNWPKMKENQLLGMFFYEPQELHRNFLTPDVLDHFDFTMTSQQSSDLPVTLICPWGKKPESYLRAPPRKTQNVLACDWSGMVAPSYDKFFTKLRDFIEVDSYHGKHQNSDPPSPFNVPAVMRIMSTYKFAIVTENTIENDWIGPELSQVWLSGTVPVYIGAPNIDEFLPGPHSIIKASDFETPEALADYLIMLSRDDAKYRAYFDWKNKGLSPSFVNHLNNCVHSAECRICHHVLEEQAKLK